MIQRLWRDAVTRVGARSIKDLQYIKHGKAVKIGGLIVVVQPSPTAKGFAFLTVEEPDGMVDIVVSSNEDAQYRAAIRSTFVLIKGVAQKDHGAINVIPRAVKAV